MKINLNYITPYESLTFLAHHHIAIQNGTSFNHPHTVLLHFSPLDVKNLHGTQVTESQFKSRSLLKTFAVAAASARSKHGVS